MENLSDVQLKDVSHGCGWSFWLGSVFVPMHW